MKSKLDRSWVIFLDECAIGLCSDRVADNSVNAATTTVAPTVPTLHWNRTRRERRRRLELQGNSICCCARRRQPLAAAPTFVSVAGDTRCEQVRRGLRASGIQSRHRFDVADFVGRLPVYQSSGGPREPRPGAKLPVMVWIYGGGFVFGSSAMPINLGDSVR